MSEDINQPENKEEPSQKEEKAKHEQENLPFPSRKELEDQLTAAEKKIEECENQLLRTKADLENVRRRAERDMMNERKYGLQKLIMDILPINDSLMRALDDPQEKIMRKGVTMTLDNLQKLVERHGVESINPERGEPFNPELHEAMSTVSNPDQDANTIHEVLQKGYQLHGRVLRCGDGCGRV